MGRLSVTLCGIALDNPVIPASGTFGYGKEFSEFYDLDVLGSLSFKGTTLFPREGNPLPRIAEAPFGMLNAVGLQNPGAEAVLREELPALRRRFHKPVMANISGFSIDDYATTCAMLEQDESVGWLEVNISCPNVHGGGMSFGTDPKQAAAVTAAVRKVTKKPVIMKLTPNGLSLINTVTALRIDLKTRRPVLKNVTGGLSGPAVFPIALRAVWQVYEAVKIPIVGLGGISSAEDVIEMMLAGATAVEVGAANLRDPLACPKIIEALPEAMDRYGIRELKDITGGAHDR